MNKKYFEINENRNITCQNLWAAAKVVLRGKFILINAHLKKEEKSQHYTTRNQKKNNNQNPQLQKETTKIRAETETKKTEKIDEIKILFISTR